MDTRRAFLKKASLLAGGAGIWSTLPASIQKAMAIDPAKGSTYLDAEHIVFLMQENRSFDHTYGSLQGVRGFNDPRAIELPNRNKVWLQTNAAGQTFAPFRLDIKNTKATWMHSLPHSWTNQVDARNKGKYDQWLNVKQSGDDEYKDMPLTMGFYNREDIPFYYALADAFTVCDQNFCSSLTGTTPNRLYFWSGTIRAEQHENSQANVWNDDADYDTMVNWKTYPERLEENGVSWKVYQNDISVEGGFDGEEDAWMANFGDNPLEYFTQYNVKLSQRYINFLKKALVSLPQQIKELENKLHASSAKNEETEDLKKELEQKKAVYAKVQADAAVYTQEKYNSLSQHEKDIHEKAFVNNSKDLLFYQLASLQYNADGQEREVKIPKGDVLYQLREDVNSGKLPTVSWIVAPETFSDHPSSAWYGAWYVSEVLDILTKNPEVWKKTIFILTYDENDGYFDHVPPFVPPDPNNAATGKVSPGIDARAEYVTMEQERRRKGMDEQYMRESPIGLGYRVPLVVASPWSRGGWVNSQVFDHTSSLQFLEDFLAKKWGKNIIETNISSWRRAVCGNLTSVFRPYNGEEIPKPKAVQKDAFIESIHQAKFKQLPTDFRPLGDAEINQLNQQPYSSALMPQQEKGIRPSCALPYELYTNGKLSADKKSFDIEFEAGSTLFGKQAAGTPFTVYALHKYDNEPLRTWSYATAAGERLSDSWSLTSLENGQYHLCVYGPNGFYRMFKGNENDPLLHIALSYSNGNAQVVITATAPYIIEIVDNSYNTGNKTVTLKGNSTKEAILINTDKSFGWYDISVKVQGNTAYEQRFAGRVETGKPTQSDPAMGVVKG